MATKRNRRPSERIAVNGLMWGDLLGVAPPIRELAEQARIDFEAGLCEQDVRQRIQSRLESEGLSVQKILLPSLTRKLMRVPLRRLLHLIADVLADKAESNKLGPALRPWLDKIGWDKWLEDYIWRYATTGETSPIYESFTGNVTVHELGPAGEKTPVVMLAATPYSDTRALVEEFIEKCQQSFPDDTFAKRFEAMYEGARYLRMHERENLSYGQIARREIGVKRPDLEEGSPQLKEMLQMETERITKTAQRSFDRADRIFDFLSAESD